MPGKSRLTATTDVTQSNPGNRANPPSQNVNKGTLSERSYLQIPKSRYHRTKEKHWHLQALERC